MPRPTRRQFLSHSAAALASAAAARRAPALARPHFASGEKIHIALIGCGGQGRADLRDFLRDERVACRAVCDVDPRQLGGAVKLIEKSGGKAPETCTDFRKIIDRRDVDAVIVATPDHWHALPAIHACQSGKDVYLEKPLATSIGEGRAILAAARKYDRVVQVGTQQRSAGHFAEAIAKVRSGALGKIRLVRAWAYLDWVGGLGNPADSTPPEGVDYDLWLGPAPQRPFNPMRFHFNFRWFWDYSGGLMTDWGAHFVDLVTWALGATPLGAMATGGKYGYPDDIMETPDTQQSILEYPSFSLVWEHMVGAGRGPWEREHGVEFHGNDGVLLVDRQGWEIVPETDHVGRPKRIERMEALPRQGGSRDYHFAHVQNFLDCVQSRERPRADVEGAHTTATACHLANIAARLRRYVRWDAESESIVGDEEAQRLVTYPYRAPWKLPAE